MKKLSRSNLSVDAYATLRELFVESDRYGPGDKVSVEELANQLGVSRTPLWGAIYRLEAEGIVEIVPRSGVYLIDFDPARIIDIYLAREALEGMVARVAAQHITDRQIAGLRANIATQRRHLDEQSYVAYQAAAIEFHELIANASRSATLERMLASIYAQIKTMRVLRKKMPPMHLPQSCDEHEGLVAALEARDVDRAERLAREHIRDLREHIGDLPDEVEEEQAERDTRARRDSRLKRRTMNA